jgi:low affinity Fe/Cu permease
MRATLPIGVFSSGGHKKASTFFARMASATATWSGKPVAFLTAVAVVVVWGISGPIFHYSDTWQLVINTGTTIVTFLMVFLIQNTQNHDTEALQVKLSELILAMKGADNKVAGIEDATEDELQKAHQKVKRKAARKKTDSPLRDA